MSFRQTTCSCYKWLTFWLVLSTLKGQDASLLPGEENNIKIELDTTSDDQSNNPEFPDECRPRRLTKRSNSFVSRLGNLDSKDNNCEIFPLTTPAPPTTRVKITARQQNSKTAALSGCWPWKPYFLPYYSCRQNAFYYPMRRGVHHYKKNKSDKSLSLSEESSEEKRKRHT